MIDRVMSALFRTTENIKITPSKPLDKIQPRELSIKQKLAAELTREIGAAPPPSKDDPTPDTAIKDGSLQLPYVPLPLRSDLYPNARFYGKLQDFRYKTGEQGESKMIFCLQTNNLGSLWFNLVIQPGKLLSIQCLTEQNQSAELFRQNSELLQTQLADLGFASVIVTCRPKPGIQGISDIDPEMALVKPIFLLDRQV